MINNNQTLLITSATRQVRQQWFSVGIFSFADLRFRSGCFSA